MKMLLVLLLVLPVLLAGCHDELIKQKPRVDSNTHSWNDGYLVKIYASEFKPYELRIKVGDKVTFYNLDSRPHWPASDIHPTHRFYPEPGGCIGSRFDACKPLQKDDFFVFTFNQSGRWGYHDHLNASMEGLIVVG
ncbi:hypothetical protein HYY74_04830 [Candidatus Woesearchaeota archaeon]|nr:hypothetical protein [Candidatus Woesearchaeota archaeon]